MYALLAFVLDRTIAWAFDRVYPQILVGEKAGLLNLALTKEADVLVLGSRAQSHVDPGVLADRLGLRVYNAALDGHDLLYAAVLSDLWGKRHPAARATVLAIDLQSMLQNGRELAATQIFGPFVDDSERVREVLYADNPLRRIAYLSCAYRYNGRVLPVLQNLFTRPDPNYDGYTPFDDVLDPREPLLEHGILEPPAGTVPSDDLALQLAGSPFWDLKVRLLRGLANDATRGDGRLFLVHAPILGLDERAHDLWLTRMRRLVDGMPRVQVIDLCARALPEHFGAHPERFRGFSQLNRAGATVFSRLLAERLGRSLGEPPRASRRDLHGPEPELPHRGVEDTVHTVEP